MPLHDAWARTTPAEITFPDRAAREEAFGAIADEAEEREVDPTDPSDFVLLMEAGRTLRELRGPGEDPERVQERGLLLYHLFHAWRAEEPPYLLDTRVVRLLVESGPWTEPASELPSPAGYVQLPQHLVWVRTEGAGTPESVDGFFWTAWSGRVSFLVVMGIRPDRPGFGVVPVDPVPTAELADWLDAPVREEGDDFASAMPGAELERLYEIRTAGEVVKLAGRLFAYLSAAPDGALSREEPGSGGTGPPRSADPYIRVTLTP